MALLLFKIFSAMVETVLKTVKPIFGIFKTLPLNTQLLPQASKIGDHVVNLTAFSSAENRWPCVINLTASSSFENWCSFLMVRNKKFSLDCMKDLIRLNSTILSCFSQCVHVFVMVNENSTMVAGNFIKDW